MALPPLAPASDLAAWIGQDIPLGDPETRAGAVLSAASALVRGYTGQTWVNDAGALVAVPDDVAAVTVQVAARVWSNPEFVESITIDDSTRRWGSAGGQGVYLTEHEKDALSGYRTGSSSTGLSTLGLTRGSGVLDPNVYVPTGPPPSGPPFPWYSDDA
jgi:hypothetical protein